MFVLQGTLSGCWLAQNCLMFGFVQPPYGWPYQSGIREDDDTKKRTIEAWDTVIMSVLSMRTPMIHDGEHTQSGKWEAPDHAPNHFGHALLTYIPSGTPSFSPVAMASAKNLTFSSCVPLS